MVTRYLVYTPEYGEVVPILEYGQGPLEYTCDVVDILTRSKRDAKVLAVKVMRRHPEKYKYINADPQCCPFTGLKVESYYSK